MNHNCLENTTHRLNGGTAILLSANTYDAAGRLSQTKRGGTSVQTSTSSLTGSYTYNVRDWMTGISGTLFSETLTYETPRTGSTLPGQWGGNISSSSWTAYHTANQWYDYDYDPLGRLSEAAYGCSNSLWADRSRSYTYDLNGNLEAMETPDRSIAPAFNDDLCAWSWNSGNGSGNRPTGWEQELFTEEEVFIPATPGHPAHTVTVLNPITGGTIEEYYSYDAVGNRTAVLDAQGDTLNVMRYNRLNLPEEYTTASGDEVQYVYSADGEKLFVQLTTSANVTTGTEYAANYRVENGTLTMIHTDAGYYTPVPPPSGAGSTTYNHIWYLKDHLGNNRVLADGNGAVYAVNDYDPFGNSMTSPITGLQPTFPAGTTASPYKYGGKEWNTTTSTYDFEARQMAPGFHRFTTMDPLCEKYYGISPYAYCANNPVNLVDPDGLTDWRAIGKGSLEVLAGVGSFAGGVVLSGGTGGAGSVIGAVLIFDGVSGIGLGVSKILIGIVSDPSEETENTVDSIPSSMTGTLLKSAGMIAGDDEHEIEILGGCFMALFGAGATQSISGTAEVLSWLGTGAQIVDLFASFTTEQKPTNNENQNEDNSRKELNRQAFHEAKVDW